MSSVEWVIDGLPEATHKLLRSYVQDVTNLYGEQLTGLVLYGSAVRGEFLPGRSNLNLLLMVSSYDTAVLSQYRAIHTRWSKDRIVVPLFLTQADLRSASVVFPLEYQDIQECHRLLWGQDPFVGFKVDTRHLASQVLQSLRGNLLRLRQRLVEGGSREEAMAILLPLSITTLLPVFRGLQRLMDRLVLFHAEPLLQDMEILFELDLAPLRDALLLKRGIITPGQKEMPKLMDRYLESLSLLVTAVENRLGR
jgi:hypothetical protein